MRRRVEEDRLAGEGLVGLVAASTQAGVNQGISYPIRPCRKYQKEALPSVFCPFIDMSSFMAPFPNQAPTLPPL